MQWGRSSWYPFASESYHCVLTFRGRRCHSYYRFWEGITQCHFVVAILTLDRQCTAHRQFGGDTWSSRVVMQPTIFSRQAVAVSLSSTRFWSRFASRRGDAGAVRGRSVEVRRALHGVKASENSNCRVSGLLSFHLCFSSQLRSDLGFVLELAPFGRPGRVPVCRVSTVRAFSGAVLLLHMIQEENAQGMANVFAQV